MIETDSHEFYSDKYSNLIYQYFDSLAAKLFLNISLPKLKKVVCPLLEFFELMQKNFN